MSTKDSDTTASSSGAAQGTYFKISKLNLTETYTMDSMLGDGAFSIVHRARRISDGTEVAVKIIKKRKVSQQDLEREVEIWRLASSSSSRVVQLYDIYEDSQNVYLVMELMVGGELFEKIANMPDYSEPYAARIMKQVFLIIRDLHKVDIIHQDLKPENLLLMGKDSMILKLCDFGLAEIADDDTELFGCVGSTTYMAPEVTNESGHHKPVDVYAAGVIMYIMLCGYPPFEPENGIVDLEFPLRDWGDISDAAKELITLLLDEDAPSRPTPEEALKHKWFLDVETIRNPKALLNTIKTIKKFTEQGPNGTMKDYRGEGKGNRSSVIGLFEDTNGTAPPATANTLAPAAAGVTPVLQTVPTLKEEEKNKNESKKTNGKTEITKSTKGTSSTITIPQLPSLKMPQSSNSSPKKKGAKTDRYDKERKSQYAIADNQNSRDSKDSKDYKEGSGEKKKKKDRKKRASTSIVTLLQQTGKVDFDPKGRLSKKKLPSLESEQSVTDSLFEASLSTKRKDRKSQKKPSQKRSDKKKSSTTDLKHGDFEKFQLDDPYPAAGPFAIEDTLTKFHKELAYQNEMLELMKNEATDLKKKINEETELRQILLEKMNHEIAAVRKTAEEERRECRTLQQTLDSLSSGNRDSASLSSSTGASPPLHFSNPNSSSGSTKIDVKLVQSMPHPGNREKDKEHGNSKNPKKKKTATKHV